MYMYTLSSFQRGKNTGRSGIVSQYDSRQASTPAPLLLHFSPVREKDWRARANIAKPLFEIISSQIDILRKSHCVSKCMRKSHSVSNCMRKSHYISK
jgi:hypothetical protein